MTKTIRKGRLAFVIIMAIALTFTLIPTAVFAGGHGGPGGGGNQGHIHLQSVPNGVYSSITVYFTDASGMPTAVLDAPSGNDRGNGDGEWTKNGDSWKTSAGDNAYLLVDHIVLIKKDGGTEYRTAATAKCNDNTGVDLTLGEDTTPLSSAVVKVYLDNELVETDVDTYADQAVGTDIALDADDITAYQPAGENVVYDENAANVTSGSTAADETLVLSLYYKTIVPPVDPDPPVTPDPPVIPDPPVVDDNAPKVSFYVRFDGRMVDSSSGISSHNIELYTDALGTSAIAEDDGYDITKNIYKSGGFWGSHHVGAITGATSEAANAIIETLAADDVNNNYSFYIPDFLAAGDDVAELVKWLEDNPRKKIYFNNADITADIIVNPDNYDILWYVFKSEYNGGDFTVDNSYHIDGVVIHKPETTADWTISKTFVAPDAATIDAAAALFAIDVAGPDGDTIITLKTDSVAGGDYNYLTNLLAGNDVAGEGTVSRTYTWTLNLPKDIEYTAAETATAPEGFNVEADVAAHTVTVGNADTDAAFVNTYTAIPVDPPVEPPVVTPPAVEKGALEITKNVTDGYTVPANATFTVKDADGQVVATITYNQFVNGKYTVTGLVYGDYTIEETDGEIADTTWTYTVGYGDGNTSVNIAVPNTSIIITNNYEPVEPPVVTPPAIDPPVTPPAVEKGALEIVKTVADGYTVPAGATFTVKDADGQVVATITYDQFVDGKYTVADLLPGAYTIEETGAEIEGATWTYDVAYEEGNTAIQVIANATQSIEVYNGYEPVEPPVVTPPAIDPPVNPPVDPPVNPPVDPVDPPVDPDPVEIEEPEVPLADEPEVDLPEEEVPLTEVPQTGDNMIAWLAIALLALLGIAAVNRGRKYE